jgi:acyl-CoA synthetase (AMP-forming)/AMP-acid ligase II
MIKTKGANVAPAEVEAVLDSCSEVRVSFVVGLSHDEYGQEVAAALVPEERKVVSTDHVLERCRRELSSFKVPTFVEVIAEDDLTWLASSKVDKHAIADLLHRRRQARLGQTTD